MRIFQIGLNRCGTQTLYRFFTSNRIASVHYDDGRLALRIVHNVLNNTDPLSGYERFAFISDMEFLGTRGYVDAYKLYKALHRAYPRAVFVLNTRPRERWLRSRLEFAHGRYAELYMKVLGIASTAALKKAWLSDWDTHHAGVREYFAKSGGRLVEFDIESDSPQKLVDALPEVHLDLGKWAHVRGDQWKDRSPPRT